MEIKKNIEIVTDITGITSEGSGVGRINGVAVFIPGCAIGDTVKARIIGVKKGYAFAKLLAVVNPSPSRIAPECPVFSHCGGCAFRHINYGEELRIKEQRVADCISKIAHISLAPEHIVGSDNTVGYRNKAQYPVGIEKGEVVVGFFAPRSHRIIHASACLLQPPVFEAVIHAFEQWIAAAGVSTYDENTSEGLLRHIYIRQAVRTGELMACAVINGGALPEKDLLVNLIRRAAPQTVSILFNINREKTNVILGDRCVTVWGVDRITDFLSGKKFEISPLSFYQVNSPQAEKLYETAAQFTGLKGEGILLDLYCGAGTIGLCLSDRVSRVIGVEVVPAAVEDARRNAALNGISNAEFICADAKVVALKLAEQGLRPDVVIVDPPRKGLDIETINAIHQMNPDRVVYVSCDPATLARDLEQFGQRGYACTRIKPFDMFPRTAHVETVVLMSRVKD